ncbi:MAG: ATP-binding protein [Candidatus Aenigmarchaeota archaeon]|nr:ATP-binding protein [Candidatus Aenigmarchaeota archaeon]
MKLGTVISTQDSPSTGEFYFVAEDKDSVKKGLFVQVSTKEGLLIARIEEIIVTNRYFMQPETISNYSISIDSHFPTDKWEYLVCKAHCLGILGQIVKRSNYPTSPGASVYLAKEENLKKLFRFAPDGLHLGELIGHKIAVKLNLNRLFQKHLAILALSGAGKSYATAVLVEELLSRSDDQGRVGTLVIDPHGEYSAFAYDEKFSQKTNLVRGKDIRIGLPKLSSNYLELFLPELSFVQKRDLVRVFEKLKKGENVFGMPELMAAINADECIKQATKDVLLSNLEVLNRTHLFGFYDVPSVPNLVFPGNLTVLDVSDMSGGKKRQMVASYFLRELFNRRVSGTVPPFIAFIEEAHNFAPEKSARTNFSKSIVETIAREGRKFNAILCLISQRPVHLSTTSLSQCNTHMYLRITNPYDKKHIGESSEGLTQELLNQITTLEVGEALIVGEASQFPLFVSIRKKEVCDAKTGKSLEEECREYLKQAKKDRADVLDMMKE